jgi:hypothetical protein
MTQQQIEENFINSIKAEVQLNNGDELPFGYFNPLTEGKVSWMCGQDHEGKITSVYCFQNDELGTKEKATEYVTKERALHIRDTLIKDGWQKIVPPKARFKFANEKTDRPLNRKELRWLTKKLQQENPFLK